MKLKQLAGMIALTGIISSCLYGCDANGKELEIQHIKSLEKHLSVQEWISFANEQERIFMDFNTCSNTADNDISNFNSEKRLISRLEKNGQKIFNEEDIVGDTIDCEDFGIGDGDGWGDDSTSVVTLSDVESQINYIKRNSTNRYADIFSDFLRNGKLSISKIQIIKDTEMLNSEKARLLSIIAFINGIKHSGNPLSTPARGSCLEDYEVKVNCCMIEATAIIGMGCLLTTGTGTAGAMAIAAIYYQNCANIADKEYQECLKNKQQ